MRACVVLPCCRGCGVGSTLHMNCGMRKSSARERSRPATCFGSASAFQQMTFTPHTRRLKNRQALTPRTYAFRASVPGRAFPEISYSRPPKKKRCDSPRNKMLLQRTNKPQCTLSHEKSFSHCPSNRRLRCPMTLPRPCCDSRGWNGGGLVDHACGRDFLSPSSLNPLRSTALRIYR
jgi:hypothetical protein